jgi:hypothetical protein
MVVGYCPSWLKPDWSVSGNRFKSMPLAVFDNVWLGTKEAIQFGFGDEEVLYMNDDFFCLDPMTSVPAVRRNSDLAGQIAQFPENAGLWWPRSLRLTASWLADQGFHHPESYEVHRPLPAQPHDMLYALDLWLKDNPMPQDTVPQWRTIYGVINSVTAYPVTDAKLGLRVSGVGSPWISTSDQSWRKYAPDLKRRFQKPSRWEI